MVDSVVTKTTVAVTGPQITVVVGTRPEAIKLAPVVRALRARGPCRVVLSGQHMDLVEALLPEVGLRVDKRLGVMRHGQTLNVLTERLVAALSRDVRFWRPDAVVVQGDTTTALCAALVAFHEAIPIAHVEAGLRSYDRYTPFPEEMNRRLVGQLATWHFAPTLNAARNLSREGLRSESIEVTGNTVVDSLRWIQSQSVGRSAFRGPKGRRVLVTWHRRETQGRVLAQLSEALGDVARGMNLEVVLPLHPSPVVRESIVPRLSENQYVRLREPLGYVDFVATLSEAALVVTDSGGVQEEAVSLGVPTLVTRGETERPEALASGGARLIGTDPDMLIESVESLMSSPTARSAMQCKSNPFGDGRAADRIVVRLLADLASDPHHEASIGIEQSQETCKCMLI